MVKGDIKMLVVSVLFHSPEKLIGIAMTGEL